MYKKRFVTNLHRVMTKAHFQKWCATYAFAIPNDVHVVCVNILKGEYSLEDPSTFELFSISSSIPVKSNWCRRPHLRGISQRSFDA